MSLLSIVLISAACLLTAYFTYGRLLARLLQLRPDVPTPAVEMRDDVDYAPIDSKFLLSQHFSAIAAAGPIVGPILAGVMFGWLPALLWILVGSIFIGGVHDMTALVASIRHKARSIAEVVRDHMSRRSYLLFLAFVWLALVYIIVAFTDVTASSFLGVQELESGEKISGGGIATSSLLYLALPIVMGLLLRYTKLSVGWATGIFLPLVGVSIWAGQLIPFDVSTIFGLDKGESQMAWNVALLAYCLIASVVPMWLLLQPRGHLGGYFLYIALFAGMLGIIAGGRTIEYPMFKGFHVTAADGSVQSLFPLLFITIACGACSGFHSIIASGTTSKQLQREPDARVIGYGAMLLEAMVAIVSLCCVMMLPETSPHVSSGQPKPNFLYAQGIGSFMSVLGVPAAFGVSFGLMAFTTFVYDTLDVCTRLGRYILQELTGMQGRAGRWLATALTAGVPLIFLLWQPTDAKGRPAWLIFWNLFGASNQLLAALTLLGVTVWLWRTYRAKWVLFVTGLPCVWMYAMSMWALVRLLSPLGAGLAQAVEMKTITGISNPVPWVALVLASLGALMLLEAVRIVLGGLGGPPTIEPRRAVLPT
jgi:carbon starvation protein